MRYALLALLVAAALSAPSASAASGITTFRTPSGNILCAYLHVAGAETSLRCDILSGLEPPPKKPASCEFDWGGSVGLNRTGKARSLCVSDTPTDPLAKVIPYGATWRLGPFKCVSTKKGLECSNASKRGFFLSRGLWYFF